MLEHLLHAIVQFNEGAIADRVSAVERLTGKHVRWNTSALAEFYAANQAQNDFAPAEKFLKDAAVAALTKNHGQSFRLLNRTTITMPRPSDVVLACMRPMESFGDLVEMGASSNSAIMNQSLYVGLPTKVVAFDFWRSVYEEMTVDIHYGRGRPDDPAEILSVTMVHHHYDYDAFADAMAAVVKGAPKGSAPPVPDLDSFAVNDAYFLDKAEFVYGEELLYTSSDLMLAMSSANTTQGHLEVLRDLLGLRVANRYNEDAGEVRPAANLAHVEIEAYLRVRRRFNAKEVFNVDAHQEHTILSSPAGGDLV